MTASPLTPLDLDGLEIAARTTFAGRLKPHFNAETVLALIAAARESASLRADLDAMTKERDEARHFRDLYQRDALVLSERLSEHRSIIATQSARERTLIGLVKTAREALEPFASTCDFRGLSLTCTQSDLRRAASALTKLNEATK